MYKAVFVDVDGVLKSYTLQNSIESFDTDAINGIRMLEDYGIKICYASGKTASYVIGCLNCSGFDGNGFIAGENGGVIIDKSNSVVKYDKYFNDLEFFKKSLPLSNNKWNVFNVNGLRGWVMEEEKTASLTILLSGLNPEKFAEYLEEFIKSAGLHLTVLYGPSYIDVIQNGADKSYSLNVFSEKTGIKLEEMVGIGDGKNDLTMLRMVGLPSAPANAISEVRGIVLERNGYLARKSVGNGFLEICRYIVNNSSPEVIWL
jgi:HAD superfamily hydrolase (TIGR01484 family)